MVHELFGFDALFLTVRAPLSAVQATVDELWLLTCSCRAVSSRLKYKLGAFAAVWMPNDIQQYPRDDLCRARADLQLALKRRSSATPGFLRPTSSRP